MRAEQASTLRKDQPPIERKHSLQDLLYVRNRVIKRIQELGVEDANGKDEIYANIADHLFGEEENLLFTETSKTINSVGIDGKRKDRYFFSAVLATLTNAKTWMEEHPGNSWEQYIDEQNQLLIGKEGGSSQMDLRSYYTEKQTRDKSIFSWISSAMNNRQ